MAMELVLLVSNSWSTRGRTAALLCLCGLAALLWAPATAAGGGQAGDRVKVSVRVQCSLGVDRNGRATSNCPVIQIGHPEDGMVSYMVLDD